MIWELYPNALDCGISATGFWELSLAEITDLMQSYKRRHELKLKQELINGFTFAEYTARYVAVYLNNENKQPHPWDFFPGLFAKEKEAWEEHQEQEQMETARGNRKAYAAALAQRRDLEER